MSVVRKKKIVVCPLDWGLGHATRMMPLITFLKRDFQVIVAAGGNARSVIIYSFPELQCLSLPGMKISYSGKNILKRLFAIAPLFIYHSVKEHFLFRKIVDQIEPDIIISDNRYGIFSRKKFSILITHQLFVSLPQGMKFLQPAVSCLLRKAGYFFNECWIPDIPGNYSLSGSLSAPAGLTGKYFHAGWLSHFSVIKYSSTAGVTQKWQVIAIISGPEPQRSALESILANQLSSAPFRSLMVCGRPSKMNHSVIRWGNLEKVPYMNAGELLHAISRSGTVICRSGYSSIADIATIGKKAIFIPTPGQPEQEYLARRLEGKGWYYYEKQDSFNLIRALARSEKYVFPASGRKISLLADLIKRLKYQKI